MTPKRGDAALEVVSERPAPTPVPRGEPGWSGDDEEVSLGEYLDVVLREKWLILAILLACVATGAAYVFLAQPVYHSDVLIEVEQKKSGLAGFGELAGMFGEASPAETEIEILRSRTLVGVVVDRLKLDLYAAPRRFPVLGRAIARRYAGDAPADAWLGFGRYGWGGERISVSRLEVPPALESEPLTLEARDGGRFVIRDSDDGVLAEGVVGEPVSRGGVEVYVAELVARPGTEFVLVRTPRDVAVADLQEDLRIAEKGKKTGILQIALEGTDPARTAAILDALANAYLRQNVERKSAEAGKTLEFLETQLPVLRTTLDGAERELESYRSRKGSVDVTLETQAAVARAVEVEKAASELQVEHAALRQRFTENHPALVSVREKLEQLQAERASIDQRLRKLPAAELESAKRLRDVKVANELYLTLLNKAQELRVVKEGTIGNVRILDPAIVPAKPVSPKGGRVLALAGMLGLGLGIALAFARKALDHGVEDPDAVERATGVGVHASIPHSDEHATAERGARREHARIPVLADTHPKCLAVESLRSLRTSLQFALLEAANNVVTLGGPAPGVGKSFVTVNLAKLVGEAGTRVLVIDADLRRGHLHRYYGLERARGVSDVVGGHLALADAVRDTPSPNVRFLSTGTVPPNPAELLGSERFERLLAEAAKTYDLVLVDTPPILAVTDAAVVARRAGVNLFVVRSGKHPIREIVAAVRQFGRHGSKVHGIVMNDVRLDRGVGRRGAYHYQYHYD
jgi:tyrosine-protein kinase Etk/Wzc